MKSITTTYNEHYSKSPIPIADYRKIVNGFMKFLMNKVFDGDIIELPYRLGTLCVKGKQSRVKVEDNQIKGIPVDWKATQNGNYTQKYFHFNDHSNGIIYKFFWSKKNSILANKSLFAFKASFHNRRYLASLIKSGKEYLIE